MNLKTPFFLILLASITAVCEARTFKVLDTATDLPIAEVEAYIVARGILPGIGHPTEITLSEWHRKSDKNGEFSISSIWADRAKISSLHKRGYGEISSVKEYLYRKSEKANPDIYFLTPSVDLNSEYIKYLAYISAEAVLNNKGLAGLPPIMNVAIMYEQAKGRAKTNKELEALHEFCQFSSKMKSEAAEGWPNMGIRPEPKKSGLALIEDCKTPH